MKRARFKLLLLSFVGVGVLVFGGLLLLRVMVVHTWRIPSTSMYPAFNSGDVVAGLMWPYRSAQAAVEGTRRGDVVIFTRPEQGQSYLSRVVGLPGDTIETGEQGEVRVNGVSLPRCALGAWPEDERQRVMTLTAFLETQGDRRYVVLQDPSMARSSTHAVVAPGQVFVMGDNRDNAFDSRYAGTVPYENLNARALRVVYPGEDSALWKKSRLGHEVHGAPLVPASMDEALLRCQP